MFFQPYRTQNSSKLGASKLLHLMERKQDDGILAADFKIQDALKCYLHVLRCSSATLKEYHETA